jgi:hypothetical protein
LAHGNEKIHVKPLSRVMYFMKQLYAANIVNSPPIYFILTGPLSRRFVEIGAGGIEG